MKSKDKPKVVVLGGGNGTSRLLLALRPWLSAGKISSLHALVHMADDGGSTGRLRDQYGVAAMGDLTKSLMALSSFRGDVRGDEFLEALEYRFAGGDFQGHTLRNIFLTSLEKTSDIDTAIATMARILQVPKYSGVVPTTLKPLTQRVVIEFDGRSNLLGEGQHSISHRVNLQADPRWKPGDVRVQFAEGDVPLNPRAEKAIAEATYIIVAPGHTYGTILPTLALPALGRAVKKSKAKIIVVMPLLTTPRQTTAWTGEDFVRVYELYMGREVDVVLVNTDELGMALVEGQAWVEFKEKDHKYDLIEVSLVSAEKPRRQDGDVVPRAIVVHDEEKVRKALLSTFDL
ncbi:MAG: 2-phospho-L-lactate transferase CofD family protein [Candidatus Andersenbacteria bacterium]|nr:2-phospho-L-lactate transferase CofD family protein [bacterium]MDZ4225596.1 2-phospho-L-lactate transferase CofD family protein [Candidatus Andersenbacteria bacterium]